jgi:BTB/POZ domain
VAKAKFFGKAWAESRLKEGQTGVIELKEDEPVIVKAMLQFLYILNYGRPAEPDLEIITHAKVYTIAEKYDINTLQTLACSKLKLKQPRSSTSSTMPSS